MNKKLLSNKQLKTLKSMAHGLSPVVRVGQHGLSTGVYSELDIALDHHELIKIKVAADDREARLQMLEQLAKKSGATIVQSIGSVAVLYRQNPDKQVISI